MTVPLDYGNHVCRGREIRLLEFHDETSDAGGVLSCTMRVASLDSAPEYNAISYVWGDESDRRDIIVGQAKTRVPASAERALRHLHRVRAVPMKTISSEKEPRLKKYTGLKGR